MKKKLTLIILCLSLPAIAQAVVIDLGFQGGYRMVNSADIREVYGNGICYFPNVNVIIFKRFIAGAGYEFGYSRSGKIGIYQDDTSLKVSGMEVLLGYQHPLKFITPYLVAGLGSFAYQQTVDSPLVKDVDSSKLTFFIAGGVKFYPIRSLFISGEIKFVPLSVKPYDEEVDLGGIRFMAGLGYSFGF
jgi:opacity protein-like surface antigen